MIISDIKESMDPAQCDNQKNLSIQYYLLRLLHRIITNLERNCHTLAVKSFINNDVRASIIPLLSSYFEEREMCV